MNLLFFVGVYWLFTFSLFSLGLGKAETVALSGYTTEGLKKWDVLADFAEVIENGQKIILALPQGILYEKGDAYFYLNASKGSYYPKTGSIYFKENVHVNDKGGTSIKTEQMFWQAEEEILTMENNIKLSKANTVLTGKRA